MNDWIKPIVICRGPPVPREAVMNNLVAYLKDLRARAAKGEDLGDRIRAVEKRIGALRRRVG